MFGKKSAGGAGPAASARQIKTWARELLALGDDATVLVSELACSEPGCPPLETVIAVLRGPGEATQHKIHRAAAELTRDDVAALLLPPPAPSPPG